MYRDRVALTSRDILEKEFKIDTRGYRPQEAQQKLEDYKRLAKPLTTYFTVSIIIDFNNRLGYKDSPIDQGEKIFNELMKERVYI